MQSSPGHHLSFSSLILDSYRKVRVSLDRIWTINFRNFQMEAMPLGLLKKREGILAPKIRICATACIFINHYSMRNEV